MSDYRVYLEIDAGAGQDVRLEDFIRELRALTDTLLSADNFVAPGEKLTEYVVRDLHHSTPTIVLEAFPVHPDRDYRDSVLTTLLEGVRYFSSSGRAPMEFTADTIEKLRDLTAPVGEGIRSATIRWRGRSATIGADLKDALKKLRISDDTEDGEIDGFLEQINIHGAPTFRVYPVVGPEFLTCEYGKHATEAVKAALGKYVIVTGELRYRKGARHPYRVRVRDIDILDEASQPTLEELRGIASSATGEEDTAEYLRRLRDGW